MSIENHHRSRSVLGWLSASVVLAVGATSLAVGGLPAIASDQPAIAWDALILADTDRNGTIDAADQAGRGTWTEDRGAFFLANLDDDLQACPTIGADGTQLSDVALASCNDAADDIVNGDSDVKDLARVMLGTVDESLVDAVRVEVIGDASKVNLFVNSGTGATADDWTILSESGAVPVEDGVELGIEGTDIIRDASWDGTVVLRVVHEKDGATVASDEVELRVAPLLFVTDLMPIQTLYAADNLTSVYEGNETVTSAWTERTRLTAVPFQADLRTGLDRIDEGIELELLPSMEGSRGGGTGTDVWTQDVMEPGFMSIATPEGEQSMRVFLRAPGRDGRDNAGVNPFRQTGRIVFTELRGPDVAGIQHFDPNYVPAAPAGNASYDTFGSTGNYGTIPAYEHDGESYPLGRKLFGSVDGYTADPSFNAMLEAQGFQDPITVDTSWLGVGHIDEVVSFIPADTERGWAMVVADPQLGFDALQGLVDAGRGEEQFLQPYEFDVTGITFPTTTIAATLANQRVIDGTATGVAGSERVVAKVKDETGITDADIIRVPVLYTGNPRVGVALPNAANLIGTGHDVVFIAKQHSPTVDGSDLFQAMIEERFAAVGTEIQWVEDYRYAHPGGEIHCVTNAARDHSFGDSWWTEGAAAQQPALDATVSTTARTLGSSVYLTVATTNEEAVPVTVVVTTPYGTKSFANVGPGRTASVSFNARRAAIPAGEVSSAVSAVVDGETVTATWTAPYASFGVGS